MCKHQYRIWLVLVSTPFLAVWAHAASFTVSSDADSGGTCPGPDCTLREAIATATWGDSIYFAPEITTIILTSDRLLIDKDLTINGPGRSLLTVQRSDVPGTPDFRIFSVVDSIVTISGMTILNGKPPGGFLGGAVYNSGDLTINACTIAGSSSNSGGGIYNNGGDPGAYLTITGSTISGNSTLDGFGGGIFDGGGVVNITNSAITNNSSGNGPGGGICTLGVTHITNSTISGNTSGSGSGGGIEYRGSLYLTNCTISNNSAGDGGGIHKASAREVYLRNTIVAKNTAGTIGPDISATVHSQGYNVIGDTGGMTFVISQNSDQLNVDPLLAPLQDNGGPAATQALLPGSPAINKGNASGSVTDQRGFNRPVGTTKLPSGDGSDIGAFEVQAAAGNYNTLGNLSTRLLVGTGDDALIGGFIIIGTQPKKVVARAIGPSLPFPETLADPTLELHWSSGDLISSNDNWRSDYEADILATGIPPANDAESAIVATLDLGNGSAYTAVVRGANNTTGIGVVEVYDLDQTADAKLANISTRGLVQSGNNVLIAGTIVLGQVMQRVIVRAIGPSLPLAGNLADPILELRDGNGGLIRMNDNWRTDQEQEIIATTIPPTNDLESAIVETLPANGATYTAIVRGTNGTSGIAVVEIYTLTN